MRPRVLRSAAGLAAAGSLALFSWRTTPNALAARDAHREACETIDFAEEALARIGHGPSASGDWRMLRLEAAAFLAGDLALPPGEPAELEAERGALLRRLAGPEIPERLLNHLLPPESWEKEKRTPSAEEADLGWRKLRIASVLLETLVSKGVTDFGYLVFPDGARKVGGGESVSRVRLKLRYAAPASVQGSAYAALLGRRERGPFFVPDRLVLSADPTGAGRDRVLVLLEAHVPLAPTRER